MRPYYFYTRVVKSTYAVTAVTGISNFFFFSVNFSHERNNALQSSSKMRIRNNYKNVRLNRIHVYIVDYFVQNIRDIFEEQHRFSFGRELVKAGKIIYIYHSTSIVCII